jgi:hypothetical protein
MGLCPIITRRCCVKDRRLHEQAPSRKMIKMMRKRLPAAWPRDRKRPAMKNICNILLLALFVAACQSMEPARKSSDTTDRPAAGMHQPSVPAERVAVKGKETASVSFIDSSVFDSELHEALSKDTGTVYVTPAVRFGVNNIPPRMDKWLAAVKRGGGKVVARHDTAVATRGLIAMAIDVAVALYEQVEEKMLYEPAEHYDATLYYGVDGKVERVLFVRR